MKSAILTATAALLAGTTLAIAQGNTGGTMGNHVQGAAPAPAAQQNAPPEKAAPAGAAQNHMPAQTTGQADKTNADKSNADMKAKSDTRTNATERNDTAGKANEKSSNEKSSMDNNAGGKNGKAAESNASRNNATTGQGAAASHGKANLTTEQRTKIRTVIKEKVHVRPLTHVNFSVNVGTTVPRSVHVYPVPADVVTIYPEWRGYNFVLVNDEIVIIDPATFAIVEVIT
jgi:hypothetical protein